MNKYKIINNNIWYIFWFYYRIRFKFKFKVDSLYSYYCVYIILILLSGVLIICKKK